MLRVDLFSRKILALRVFRGAPSGTYARAVLREAVARHGKPTWIVTDHGPEFTAAKFTRYLVRRKIRRRFGAVGRKTSGAVIERFWRTLKAEVADAFFAWLPRATAERKLDLYRRWFNAERGHWGLGCRTPDDLWFGRRARPRRSLREGALVVRYLGGERSMPILRLRRAS